MMIGTQRFRELDLEFSLGWNLIRSGNCGIKNSGIFSHIPENNTLTDSPLFSWYTSFSCDSWNPPTSHRVRLNEV